MMIAYLTSEYPALSHTFIRREIAALRAKGLDIRPFSVRPGRIDWGEEVPAILGRGKVRVLIHAFVSALRNPVAALRTLILAQHHREKGLKGWVWSLFHFVEALALAHMLRSATPTRLHSHFANSGATIGMLAAHYLAIPWSVTLHGVSEIDPPAGELLPDKLMRADFVACASWFMRSHAMRVTPQENWYKYHIVRCGVALPDTSSIEPAAKPIREFLVVGRIAAEKGYPGLLQAMSILKERGVDLRLQIIGDGPLRRELSQGIDTLRLSDRIKLLGPMMERDTLAKVAHADAFVLPSLIEGLPVVLMEAMAAGKPVIAPVITGIPELVEHEVTGLTYTVGDWDGLADRMQRMTEDHELASRLAEAGRARVADEFAIEKAVEPLARLFEPKPSAISGPYSRSR